MFSNCYTNRSLKAFLFGTACAFVMGIPANAAFANPEGGVVAGGSADIAYSGNKLDIYQHTDKAVIDWRSFNIGAMEHTQFHQPGSGSLTVNRINDINPSRIDGKLSANGQIVLINPNGVVFGAGSRVDVGSLTVSTADISNEDAMAGNMNFNRAGSANGRIVNEGHITARDAGLVTLVAPQVENSGIIEAKLGKVTLASAETFTIDMAGDGLVKVAVDSAQLQQHVKNSGSISADGGSVVMSAGAARDIVDSLIVNTGQIRAKKGTVKMAAAGANKTGKQGTSKIINQGHIDVSGTDAPGDKGGNVVLTADDIELGATSVITADGHAGGGTINIGGDYLGQGIIPTSRRLHAEAGSRTTADAIETGDGGRIIYWSDDTTTFNGLITARGGAFGGKGGFVETSGKINLGVDGIADVSAINGEGGLWLLDPSNVRIIRPGGTNIGGGTTNASSDDFLINADSIQTALNGGSSVTITTNNGLGLQAGDIIVDATLSWTTSNSLSLQAHNDIIVNQAITGRSIYFYAGATGDVQLNANISSNLANNGTLLFATRAAGGVVGVGTGAAGALNLSNSDLSFIQNGFDTIQIGHDLNVETINMNAASWQDHLTLQTTNTGTINIDGAQTMNDNRILSYSRNLNIGAGADITGIANIANGTFSTFSADVFNINANLSAGVTTAKGIQFRPNTVGYSMGVGDGATCAGTCDVTIGSNILNRILDGFSGILFYTRGSGNLDVQSHSWNDRLILQTELGVPATITVNGTQTMNGNTFQVYGDNVIVNAPVVGFGASSLITADSVDIAANMTASGTSSLSFYNRTTTSIGVGDGAAGALHLSDAELGRITANTIGFGDATTTTAITVDDYNWNSTVSLTTTTGGTVTINGAQTLNGNNITANTGTLNVNGAISGGAYTSTHTVFYASNFNIHAPITTTSGLFFHMRAASDPVITAALNASSVGFMVSGGAKSLGIGDGAAGNVKISNSILDLITGGIGFGGAPGAWEGNGWSAIDVREYNWNNRSIRFSGDSVTFNGNQNFGTGGLTIYTSTLPTFVGDVTAGGGFNLYNLRTAIPLSIGLGDSAVGGINFSNAYLDRLKSFGFSSFLFNVRNAIDVTYSNWGKSLSLYSGAGQSITLSNNLNFDSGTTLLLQAPTLNLLHNIISPNVGLSIYTDTLNFPGTVTGSIGNLFIRPYGTSAASIGIGDASSGDLKLTNADIAKIQALNANYTQFYAGNIDMRDMTWNMNAVTFSGILTVNGAQTFNNSITTLDLFPGTSTINAPITGTGQLIVQGHNSSHLYIGSGATGGAVSLTDASLAQIGNTFASTTFSARNINVNRLTTWNFAPTFSSAIGYTTTVQGAQNFGAYDATFRTNSMALNANLTGTGILTFQTASAVGFGLGDGSVGALNLDNNELNRIGSGFSNVVFGSNATHNIAMDIRARTWNFTPTFLTASGGSITVNGIQNFGNRNATFGTNYLEILHNLTGTGTLTIGNASALGMRLGNGGVGALHLDDNELARIQDGFGNLVFGNMLTTTLDLRAGAAWRDHTTFRGDTITVSTAQNFGGNNTSFQGDEINIAANLSNGNNLQLTSRAINKGIEIGSTNASLLNLTTAELAFIQNGWNNIVIGGADHEAIIVVNEAVTFQDNAELRNRAAYGEWMVDVNAAMTTIDNANLSLVGGSAGTNPHPWTAVQVDGNINVANDFFIVAYGNLGANTGTITAARDVNIYSNTASYLAADITAGRDFLFRNHAQAFAIMAGKSVKAGRDIDLNLLPHAASVAGFTMQAGASMQADGNIIVRSHMVELDATSSISGNANGSSTLTFIESGENDTMTIGAATAGTTWSMTDSELAAINSNFSNVTFGSTAMKGDIIVDSWDLSSKAFNVQLLANDITLRDTDVGVDYALNLGTGNFLTHAQDSDNTLTPADAGDLSVTGRIIRNVGGHAKLDLRADSNITLAASIRQEDPNTDLDNNPATNPATLDILVNANRDAQTDGGAIALSGGSLTSNGGNIALTGGNLDDGSNGGIAGDGIVDGWAMGTSGHGVTISGHINAGAGRVQIAGRGFDLVGAQSALHGILINSGAKISTGEGSAGITMRGMAGSGLSDNNGLLFNNGHVEAYTGAIDIRGTGGAGTARNNGVVLVTGSTIASKGTGSTAATVYVEGQQGGTAEGGGIAIGNASVVSSIDGDITLKGTGGAGSTGHAAEGIRISSGGAVRSTGTTADAAKINITAQGGGSTVYGAHYGLVLYQAGIESVAGDIDITATGGTSGGSNYGLFMETGTTPVAAHIETTGSAGITIRATGGNGTQYNAIRMVGSSYIGEGALAGSASGNINFITDGFDLTTTGTISTLGDIIITPTTNSTNITLGADQASRLSLNDAELALFSAGGKFVIGNAASGTGDVTIDTWSMAGKTHNVEIYGGNVNVTGAGVTTMGAGSLLLNGKTQVVLNSGISGNTTGALTLQSLGVVSIGSGGINNTGNGAVTLHAGTDGTGILYLNGFVTTGGAVTLTAGTNDLIYLHSAADVTGTGITFNSNAELYGTAGITRTINARDGVLTTRAITAGDRNLTLIADNMTLDGNITTGASRNIDIRTHTAGRAMTIGGGAGGLELSDAEIAFLQPGGLLTLGTATTGTNAITVNTADFNGNVALYGAQIVLNGMTSPGTIFARSQGAGNDISLTGVVSSAATGDAITLVSADDFFNSAGAGALHTSNPAARWLVYSERMDENVRGGLMPDAVEFNVSYPTAAAGAGNRFLYSSNVRPTLTLKVNDDEIFYDEDYLSSRFGYAISGGLIGGDTMGDIGLTGALDYATSYIFGITDPSPTPYDDMLTATAGTLSSRLGYQIGTIDGGQLLVKGVRPPSGPQIPAQGLPSTYQMVSTYPTVLTVMSSGQGTNSSAGGASGTTGSNSLSVESNGEGDEEGQTQGRLSLTFADAYAFSTYGLKLNIDQQVRSYYGLPE